MGPAAALLPPCCVLHSHPTYSHKPKTLQEHLSCFLLGKNQGKTGVHQTQTGFISYIVLWYLPGKEKVSLHACNMGGSTTCLLVQQGGKAIHLVEVHCFLERALQHPTALLLVCLSTSESHLHTSRSFLTLSLSGFVSPQCSKSVANLSCQRQIRFQRREVLHHHLLMKLAEPQATPTHHSHPHLSVLSAPPVTYTSPSHVQTSLQTPVKGTIISNSLVIVFKTL